MWNYLKSYFKTFDLIRKIYYIFLTFICLIMPFAALPWSLIFAFAPGILIKKLKDLFSEDVVVPYWGAKFGKKAVYKLLAGEKFTPYVDSDGKTHRNIRISSSGRWIYIKSRYYPVPFIRKFIFDAKTYICHVCMIDGKDIGEQAWWADKSIKKVLAEMNENHFDFPDDVCEEAFSAALKQTGDTYESLAKADWNEFRYLWEQECREKTLGKDTVTISDKNIRRLTDPNNNGAMYNRSLTDDEIAAIAQRIKDGRFKNADRFKDISKYKKDIYVINAIRLYEKLGYPDNIKAEDFLFGCIRDIEKPYCDDAIRVLAKFPRNHLIASIERYVKKAHEEEDFVFGAGLLALSRAIDYEISLEKDASRSVADAVQTEVAGFVADSDGQQGAVAVKFKM